MTGSNVIHVTGSDVTGGGVPGSDVSHVTESDVTGGDVIFPMLFSFYSSRTKCPLTLKTKGIIRSRQSNDKQHNDQKIPKE